MTFLVFIFIFLLGTIIGSFLNVVIYRFNTGKTIVHGRSICMTCNRNLRWYELIPILSFLIQSGKCRRCASKISHQYPLVELATGFVFALFAFHFLPILPFGMASYVGLVVLFVFIFSLLIVISVYDIRHKVIPDKLVYVFAFISFISIFINHSSIGPLFIAPTLMDIISGPLFALPFALIWMFSRGKAMGLGDAKLMLGIGWMLGVSATLASVILSFWIGSVVGLAIMFFSRRKMDMKTEISFAPFLVIGALITLLFNLDIFKLSSLFHL
jgi:leader peptidase (prepilin peptidase) / N-methyltransferase